MYFLFVFDFFFSFKMNADECDDEDDKGEEGRR